MVKTNTSGIFLSIILLFACPAFASLQADLNTDGCVDGKDFSIFACQWLYFEPNDVNNVPPEVTMTRDQICIEQSRFNQAYPSHPRGANIWTPLGNKTDRWLMWRLKKNPKFGIDGVEGWALIELYACRVLAGTYIPAYSTTNKPPELSFPDGNWGESGGNHWRTVGYSASSRKLRITVPANTTRLYIYALPQASSGTGTLSVYSGSAQLVKSSWDFSTGGDFDFGEYDGFVNYFSFAKIATNCGGAVLDLTPAGDGWINVAGFIAINDNEAATPDTGVFDPETLNDLMPIGNSMTAKQSSDMVVVFKLGSEGEAFWWGMFHWDGYNTLANDIEKRYYGDEAVDWNPLDNTWVREVSKVFCKRLTGDIQCFDTQAHNCGTFECLYRFSATGLMIKQRFVFNSTAQAQDLHIPSEPHAWGGYCGMFSLCYDNFDRMKTIPFDSKTTQIKGPFDNRFIGEADVFAIALYGTEMVAFLESDGWYYDDLQGKTYSYPGAFVAERSGVPTNFHKIYCNWFKGSGDIDIKESDVLEGWEMKLITEHCGLESP